MEELAQALRATGELAAPLAERHAAVPHLPAALTAAARAALGLRPEGGWGRLGRSGLRGRGAVRAHRPPGGRARDRRPGGRARLADAADLNLPRDEEEARGRAPARVAGAGVELQRPLA